VLQVLCAVLILQLLFILVASSLRKTAPVFVPPFRFPGADYHAYYIAAHNLLEGTNPYFHPRFVTPPVSLWWARL
jgi:hypothetical protein